MPTIILRLDPAKLDNPDADIRYALPRAIELVSSGLVREDGYDYEEGDVMVLFLATEHVDQALNAVARVLLDEVILGNALDGQVEISVQ